MKSKEEIENKITEQKAYRIKILQDIDRGFVSSSDYEKTLINLEHRREIIGWLEWVLDNQN